MDQRPPDDSLDPSKHKGLLPTYMKQGIPPYLQILFAARAPLPYLPPLRKPPLKPTKGFFESIDYDHVFRALRERRQRLLEEAEERPPPAAPRSQEQQRVERWKARMEAHIARKEREWRAWLAEEKHSGANKSRNAHNTLVVSGLPRDCTEELLRREMDVFGPVVFVRLVRDREGRSRCYGFVEYAHHADFLTAYRNGSNKKILKRRVTVDAEFARTKPFFRPLRLGGGAGSRRRTRGARFLALMAEFRRRTLRQTAPTPPEPGEAALPL